MASYNGYQRETQRIEPAEWKKDLEVGDRVLGVISGKNRPLLVIENRPQINSIKAWDQIAKMEVDIFYSEINPYWAVK